MSTIKELKCEYCIEPIGIDIEKPYFSWVLENGDLPVYQKSYKILVEADGQKIWDTGFVESGLTFNIEYNGFALENLRKYTWKVFVQTTDNEYLESFGSFFVTGFIDRTKITGQWIEHPALHDNPIFYGDFFVKKDIRSAYVMVSGLGYYEMSFNGKRAHDTYNVPGWTDYSERDLSGLLYPYDDKSKKRVLYNVYDIAKYLNDGINRYEFMLGNGFFNQAERLVEGDMSYGTPRLLFEIHIKYADESETIVKSDGETYCTDGPIEFNNIFFGEIKNDNIGLDFTGSLTAELCEWEPGDLSCQFDYFDRIYEVLKPIDIGNDVYDLGKSVSGRIRISAKAPRGARFSIKYSDAIDGEDNLDYKSTGGEWQIQETKYIFGETPEIEYAEAFGWRGFRYFSIEKDDDVEINSIAAEVVHADCRSDGYLKTDNEIIQWIYNAYLNTQLSNMHGGVPSDCPHRERLGYTGDGQVTAESALSSLDCINFLRKWNKDIIFSQNSDTGYVPHTVPFGGGGGGPAWGSACAILPSELHDVTFDVRIVHDSYKTIQDWIKYLESRNPDLIIEREEEGSWCLGDWCIPVVGYGVEEVDLDSIFKELPPELVNTAYYYECVRICIEFGSILNRDTTYYKRLADRIKSKFNEKFLNIDSFIYANGKHFSNVYALFFNMVDKSNLVGVRNAMVRQIEQADYKMDAGIFASSMIFKVLADAGRIDVVDKIINNSEYPSYGYMKKSGSLNLWETWDGGASLNHPMFGGVVAFFYKYIGGIRYISKDSRILIEPEFPESINEFKLMQKSIYGDIEVEWRRKGGLISFSVKLPGNTRGAFKHRNTVKVLENGLNILEISSIQEDITKSGE